MSLACSYTFLILLLLVALLYLCVSLPLHKVVVDCIYVALVGCFLFSLFWQRVIAEMLTLASWILCEDEWQQQ